MEFDFEPGEEVVALGRKPRERIAQDLARGERHALAVGEINIAEEPAGVRRPGQNLKGVRIGDHDEIAGALHLVHGETAAGGEDRIDGLVRRILGKERRGHGHAALHQGRRVGGDHRLAAQHAVLIGEGKANELELVFLDRLRDRLGAARLLVGPQIVALDEGSDRQNDGVTPSCTVIPGRDRSRVSRDGEPGIPNRNPWSWIPGPAAFSGVPE